MQPSRTARPPASCPSAAPSRTRIGRRRLPPASATCSPSSRTSRTGEAASSQLISASHARSASPTCWRSRSLRTSSRSRLKGLVSRPAGAASHRHRSANGGERESGAARDHEIRVVDELPVLPTQDQPWHPPLKGRAGDSHKHAVTFAPVSRPLRRRVGGPIDRLTAVAHVPYEASGDEKPHSALLTELGRP